MASTVDFHHRRRRRCPAVDLSRIFQAIPATFTPQKLPSLPADSSRIHLPVALRNSVFSLSSSSLSAPPDSDFIKGHRNPQSSSHMRSISSPEPGSEFRSSFRISTGKGGGPAFVGQVFSMCDLSGTGLMAVSTHFDIPFLSKRTPEWLKKIFAAVTKSERNGPVFRFFMDLGDAVSYVKQLNIPSGVVGSCRLDIAYEHFKEKPHLFQFVPNKKQVAEANKLLKALPHAYGKTKVEGVPVFSAQNLDIAIATKEGIKWYTPYFFDKNMLDNILEDSVDQHFQSLIETRHFQRRHDVADDNLGADVAEEMGESMWDPPEVQEIMDEVGYPSIPLSIITKAAEIQLLYAVDRVLLGNRWLRKATGIQPKFPYVIDSFERKSTSSFQRAKNHLKSVSNPGTDEIQGTQLPSLTSPDAEEKDRTHEARKWPLNLGFSFGDWLNNPWLEQLGRHGTPPQASENGVTEPQHSKLLPKITMVGISTGEQGKMSKSSLKKTMDDLTKELEKVEELNQTGTWNAGDRRFDENDPLFIANFGDYRPCTYPPGSLPSIGRS